MTPLQSLSEAGGVGNCSFESATLGFSLRTTKTSRFENVSANLQTEGQTPGSLPICVPPRLSICSVSPPPTSVSPLLCLWCKSVCVRVCVQVPLGESRASGPNHTQAGTGHGATRSLHSVTPEGPLPCEEDTRRLLHANRWQEPS